MGVAESHLKYITRRMRELSLSPWSLAGLTGLAPGRVAEILNGQTKNIGTATLDRFHEALRQVEAARARRGRE